MKNIAIVVAALIAILLAYAATRPDSFRLERSVTIKAPAEKAFALINDFHQWGAWSPWEHMDADLQRSYSGPASGVGAVYNWEGKKTGVGRMEIVETSAPSLVKIKLDFSSLLRHTTLQSSHCKLKATQAPLPGPCTARAPLCPNSWASSSASTRWWAKTLRPGWKR